MQTIIQIKTNKKSETMKTLTQLFTAAIFSLVSFSSTAQTSETAASKMNQIGKNGGELKMERNGQGVFIKWQTSAESNSSHFELQVSSDNKTFTSIRNIAASETTHWNTNYEAKFQRSYMSAVKVYYRVKTVFINNEENFTTATAFEMKNGKAVNYASIY